MHHICPDNECNLEQDGEAVDELTFIAGLIKDYFRSSEHTQMTGEGITDVLVDAIECQNDPECRGDGPDDVWEWLEWYYLDH